MNQAIDTPQISTVSRMLVDDLLHAVRPIASQETYDACLASAGLGAGEGAVQGRVSRDQIVALYQTAAQLTGDEMMGLWSRPIRTGALKQICAAMIGASSLGAAMYRMVTFWNLVLDDYQLELVEEDDRVSIVLRPVKASKTPAINRFGHMLLLKLTHGLASWLSLSELPVVKVCFAFERPRFAEDYPVLFPATCEFAQPYSSISFDRRYWADPVQRTGADLNDFLERAPRDWIFTQSLEHNLTLQVRAMLYAHQFELTLQDGAAQLNVTPRTLIRRLHTEGTSFQTIKDDLRRDIAIAALKAGQSVEGIAQDIGFSSASTFHRAFKRWTGQTPQAVRA